MVRTDLGTAVGVLGSVLSVHLVAQHGEMAEVGQRTNKLGSCLMFFGEGYPDVVVFEG